MDDRQTIVRVRAVQMVPAGDAVRNAETVASEVAAAAASGVHLVIFPEYASYFANPIDHRMVRAAETVEGDFITAVRRAALAHRVWVVVGLVESSDDERFSNTLVAIDPAGDIVAVYRKQHLYDAFGQRESDWVRAGDLDTPQTFQVGPLRVGLQTCYDIRFPEVSRRLVDERAELLVVPAEWVPGPGKEDQWMTLLRARAIENTAFVVAADHALPSGIGASAAIDPTGIVLERLDDQPGSITADLDPARLSAVRERNPALRLRRYGVVPRGE